MNENEHGVPVFFDEISSPDQLSKWLNKNIRLVGLLSNVDIKSKTATLTDPFSAFDQQYSINLEIGLFNNIVSFENNFIMVIGKLLHIPNFAEEHKVVDGTEFMDMPSFKSVYLSATCIAEVNGLDLFVYKNAIIMQRKKLKMV